MTINSVAPICFTLWSGQTMEVANLIRNMKTRQKMKAITTTETKVARPLHTFRMASFTLLVLVMDD